MSTRESVDDALQRVGLASLMYYPEVHVDEPGYRIDEDVDWCIEPLADLSDEKRAELRDLMARTITNPTAHREQLFHSLLDLAADALEG